MKLPLSTRLLGLAEWLETGGYDHNAAMVRSAATICARDEKTKAKASVKPAVSRTKKPVAKDK